MTKKVEYGDFQTPIEFALKVVRFIGKKHKLDPQVIIEPTCGIGAFLYAACQIYPQAHIYGFEINFDYIKTAKELLKNCNNTKIEYANFFFFDWEKLISSIDKEKEILFLGNPPWVTNSTIGEMNGTNLPKKTNFLKNRGIEAITGKSNFDISEWMILQQIELLQNRKSSIAQLCKTSVARKIIRYISKKKIDSTVSIYQFDAKKIFNVSVDACLLVIEFQTNIRRYSFYSSLDKDALLWSIENRNGLLIKKPNTFKKHEHLVLKQNINQEPAWRSGIKHDCSKIVELEELDKNIYKNKNGKTVQLEDKYLYPLLKGSDIAKGLDRTKKMLLVTQKKIGEDTSTIKQQAPKTWQYLINHKEFFDKRKSSIYKNKPDFSMFGIGEYTFKPWKIAISSLHKKIDFRLIGQINSKPVVFDDTVYFLSFDSHEQAKLLYQMLSSEIVKELLDSIIFWDEKRPITINILNRINFIGLAKELGLSQEFKNLFIELEIIDTLQLIK